MPKLDTRSSQTTRSKRTRSKPTTRRKGQPVSYTLLASLLSLVLTMCFATYYVGTRSAQKITPGDRMFLVCCSLGTLGLYSLSRQSKPTK